MSIHYSALDGLENGLTGYVVPVTNVFSRFEKFAQLFATGEFDAIDEFEAATRDLAAAQESGGG